MQHRILIVDDHPNILQSFRRQLRKKWKIEIESSPVQALRRLEEDMFAVVVSDMQMPEMNGAEFLEKVKESSSHSIRIMLTGDAGQQTALEAINRGHVFKFLNKPCTVDDLDAVLDEAILTYKQHLEQKNCVLEQQSNGEVSRVAADLQLGDVLSQDVKSLSGHLLLKAGSTLNATSLERLQECAQLIGIEEPIIVKLY